MQLASLAILNETFSVNFKHSVTLGGTTGNLITILTYQNTQKQISTWRPRKFSFLS